MKESTKNLPDYIEKPASDRPRHLAVPADCAGLRLDQALVRLFPEYSRNRLQEWIGSGHITLDGNSVVAKTRVWGGESVIIAPQALPSETRHGAEEIPLEVMFEDEDILVINKPAGLVVHPGSGNWSGTLLNALLSHAPAVAAVPRAGIVHRLDKETSGLLVVAKTIPAQVELVRQLQARTVTREYTAIVHGVVSSEGAVEAPIGRHPVQRTRMAVVARGKSAKTYYSPVAHGNGWTNLRCRLDTGRTHQIRVHLGSIHHPLIGDPVYGINPRKSPLPRGALAFPRQALHAAKLTLTHPRSAEPMTWTAALPADLRGLLKLLNEANAT